MELPEGMTLTPQHVIDNGRSKSQQFALHVNYVAAGRAFYALALASQAFFCSLERGAAALGLALSGPVPRWRRAEIERRIDHKYAKNRTRIRQAKSHLQNPSASKMHADYRRKKR